MPESELACPNAMVRQLLEGIQAILGDFGLQAALTRSGLGRLRAIAVPDDLGSMVTAREYAALSQALETITGRASRSTLRRIGQVSFEWEQQYPPPIDPFSSLVLKSLPLSLRRGRVLKAIALGRQDLLPGANAKVEREGEILYYRDYLSLAAYERESPTPVCDLYAGYLQQATAFASAQPAESFAVLELSCRACGDECCRFEIQEVFE